MLHSKLQDWLCVTAQTQTGPDKPEFVKPKYRLIVRLKSNLGSVALGHASPDLRRSATSLSAQGYLSWVAGCGQIGLLPSVLRPPRQLNYRLGPIELHSALQSAVKTAFHQFTRSQNVLAVHNLWGLVPFGYIEREGFTKFLFWLGVASCKDGHDGWAHQLARFDFFNLDYSKAAWL